MAIAPIDLQTLFTQLDKAGKMHASQKEGQAIQQAVQSVQFQKKIEERINQISEAQDTGEGAEKIKDRNAGNEQQQNSGRKNQKGQNVEKNTEEKDEPSVLRDLSLGRTIDISL